MKVAISEKIDHSGTENSIFIDSDNGSAIEVQLYSDLDQDNHTYKYTVRSSDNISELKQHSNVFSYNNSVMSESSDCTIDNLTLPIPGSIASLSPDNKSHVSIDTVLPVISLEIYDADNSTVTPNTLSNEQVIGFRIVISDDRSLHAWKLFNEKYPELEIGDNLSGSDNKTFLTIRDNHTLLDNTSINIQSIQAKVIDLAGNEVTVTDNITLDNVLPKISVVSLH